MYDDPSTLPAVLLAIILLVSGVAKLRHLPTAADAFVSLRLPRVLLLLKAPQLLPAGEVVLAVLLLVSSGPLAVLVSVATLALFVAYLVVILRALTFDEPVTCSCFGELGLGSVDVFTAIRNVVLVALAGLGVWSATGEGSVLSRMGDFDGGDWCWLAGVFGAIVLTWLVVGERGTNPGTLARTYGDTQADYLRTPIPYATLRDADDAPVHLRDLAGAGPVLLLLVSPSCGSCTGVIEKARTWQHSVPRVRTILALPLPPTTGETGLAGREDFNVLFDPDFAVGRLFETNTPAGILLGADGLLAGGPVSGGPAVAELMDDIDAELGTPHSEAGRGSAATSQPVTAPTGHLAPAAMRDPQPAPEIAPHAVHDEQHPLGALEVDAGHEEDDDEADYLQRPTPFALLENAAGDTVRLIELGDGGPAVVLYVSPTCGSCLDVIAAAPQWGEQLRGVPLYYLVTGEHPAQTLTDSGIEAAFVLVDENMAVGQMMGIGTPSMFAVGPDRMLLAGPVSGSSAVAETMEQIIAEVAAVRPDDATAPDDPAGDLPTDPSLGVHRDSEVHENPPQ